MTRQKLVQASLASDQPADAPDAGHLRFRTHATPGQRSAYASGLSTYQISDLWGNLGTSWVRRRLIASGVTLRPVGSNQRPSAATVEHYRRVARDELAAEEQNFRASMASRVEKGRIAVPFLPRTQEEPPSLNPGSCSRGATGAQGGPAEGGEPVRLEADRGC